MTPFEIGASIFILLGMAIFVAVLVINKKKK